jgi:aryl-alcohol dehydrogenase-like predicted oxidoreductase
MATVALAWLKAQPTIAAPIASATKVAQARELVAALTLDLTPAQIERLSHASA